MADIGDVFRGIEIKELTFGGDGVARLPDGAVVFVPFTATGDLVDIEITESHKNFNRACVLKYISRQGYVEPKCQYYGRCGGCVYQHVSYEDEIAAKRAQFASIMARIGHFTDFPPLEKFVASSQRYGYRNKLRLEPIARKVIQNGHGNGRKQSFIPPRSLKYGFCERDNESFFTVMGCPLAMDAINENIPAAARCDWAAQNAKRPQPYPLTFRLDATGKCTYYFGYASSKLPWLHETIAGNDVSVPVGSFWQVNQAVAAELLDTMKGWLSEYGKRSFVDAYAGVGTFSLAMGDMFKYRVIIESDPQAVNASRLNHEKFGLKASYIAKPTEDALGSVLAKVDTADTVVLIDPPRTGCLPKVLKNIRDFKPAILGYVSCNPSTLARDLKELCCDGLYKPVRCAAFDMFPCTAHFESAVILACQSDAKQE